jgi:hypothetical protein
LDVDAGPPRCGAVSRSAANSAWLDQPAGAGGKKILVLAHYGDEVLKVFEI